MTGSPFTVGKVTVTIKKHNDARRCRHNNKKPMIVAFEEVDNLSDNCRQALQSSSGRALRDVHYSSLSQEYEGNDQSNNQER